MVAETFARQNCAKERIRKLTIAQYDPSYLDMDRLAQDLNMLEPGWGGSATLLGSPQGASSALSLDACLFATLRRWRTTAPLVNRIG